MQPAKRLDQLMTVFGFTAADLAANEAGYLSEQQCADLQRHYDGMLMSALSYAAVVMVVGGLLVYAFAGPASGFLLAMLVIGIPAVYGVAGQIRKRRLLGADIESNAAWRVEDVIRLEVEDFRTGPVYHLHIGAEHFPLTEAQHSALEDEAVYTVYFTPHTNRILAITNPEFDAARAFYEF